MGYVEGFEHDVFLSCAPVDDQAVAGEQGWVSAFEEHLRVALSQRAGGAVKIWREQSRVDGGQLIDRTVDRALRTSAVFVALTSNGYLASDDCRRRLTVFHRVASASDVGLVVGDRPRIVNVFLTNVAPGSLPGEFDGVGGFPFHDAEHDDQIGFRSEIGRPEFKRQLRTLADAVFGLFQALNRASSGPDVPGEQQPRGALDLFISYAHEDESLREKLEEHLSALEDDGEVRLWHDRKIVAGDDWCGQIDQHLETADLILLLVSPSFLASDYCFDVETERALKRHERGEARVIPIIVRPCDWDTTRFAELQALPRDGKPITTWGNRDQAWLDVARGLRKAIFAHHSN